MELQRLKSDLASFILLVLHNKKYNFRELWEDIAQNPSQLNYKKMIDYFNQTNPSKESFLSEELSAAVLYMILNYFHYFTACEVNLASCSILPESDGLKPAMQFLEMKLSELNISFNELGYFFGQRVASVLSLSTYHSWTEDDTLQKKKISSRFLFVDNIFICYELGLDDHLLRESSKIDIYASTRNLPSSVMELLREKHLMNFNF